MDWKLFLIELAETSTVMMRSETKGALDFVLKSVFNSFDKHASCNI